MPDARDTTGAARPLLTVEDYGDRAREVFPRPLFDRLFGTYGAPDFESNTNNIDGFRKLRLRPRVLAGAAERNLSTTVLGERIDFPVMIGPVGAQQRYHPDGELAVARAAGHMGTLMALSIVSNYSIEEVAAAATGPLWFQLYFLRDRELNKYFVERAARAGYKAIVVTVDNATDQFWEEREYRVADAPVHSLDVRRLLKNFEDVGKPHHPDPERVFDAYELSGLTWADLDWLRATTSLPLIVKGIQTAEDAVRCVEHGMDALVVSNHGGHTMNRLRGTIETLPEVVDAVGGRIEIYLDGGVRTGIDVLMALALGARAVLLGRAVHWGLTLGGEDGVKAILEILRRELMVATGLCGIRDVNAIDRSLVEWASH